MRKRSAIIFSCRLLLMGGLLGSAGCVQDHSGPKILPMGERAEVGSLIYTVLESEWFGQLGQGDTAQKPRDRFVLIRMNITNSGTVVAEVPPMTLVGSGGRTYPEVRSGEGVPDWLGMLRKVDPAETIQGRVVFDAPRADYQLRVTDDAFDPEDVKVALIQIPLRFESGTSTLPK